VPLVIGLTGGIGAGKSVVADYFRSLHVPVLDADQIAHDLLRDDATLILQVSEHFGKDVLRANGELDRRQLRQKVFKDPGAKAWLEQLLHPRILKTLRTQIVAAKTPYVIAEIPLLLEGEAKREVDRILVVDCPESTQISRAAKRDHVTEQAIEDIMRHQINREARLKAANDLIENNGSLEDLQQQVSDLHAYYLSLCAKSPISSR
jgi:dephospho-CoA kinase